MPSFSVREQCSSYIGLSIFVNDIQTDTVLREMSALVLFFAPFVLGEFKTGQMSMSHLYTVCWYHRYLCTEQIYI